VGSSSISLSDRDQAIQQVIATLTSGLPVLMSLDAYTNNVTDSAGNQESLLGNMSWFLPPELAACSSAQIATAFQPYDGHDIDIIGYSIVGSPSAPDLFQSYFIIDNNWGKGWGYGGYGTMNFAAFKFLASGLTLYNLNCPYTNSPVCAPPSEVCVPTVTGCSAGQCGTVVNNCGQEFACGNTCSSLDVCTDNVCVPKKPVCSTAQSCCRVNGGEWATTPAPGHCIYM
jgi:hypothetical protein